MKALSILGLCALALGFYAGQGADNANACIAVGQPKVALQLDGKGTGKATISEYDCMMMVQKTFCVAGLRLADKTVADAGIEVRSMRFIEIATGKELQGFQPTSNTNTTAGWSRVMDGTWFGFAAIFDADIKAKGGLAIEVDFSYNPAVPAARVADAFDYGHVGLAEGDAAGRITRGHMLEVVQIQGASVGTL
jgi:hypothetical protein